MVNLAHYCAPKAVNPHIDGPRKSSSRYPYHGSFAPAGAQAWSLGLEIPLDVFSDTTLSRQQELRR